MASALERCIRVDLGPRGYDVVIGAAVLASAGERLDAIVGSLSTRRVFVAADDALPATVISNLQGVLGARGSHLKRELIRAGEDNKSLARAEELLVSLSSAGFDRGDLLIALGGGIVGDLGGFVAGTYQRGIAWAQCPTTLLAMVDASVGGKTAVNLIIPAGHTPGTRAIRKNMVGVVHQPRLVLADVDLLASLPDRTFRAGLAECIKHGMLSAAWGNADLLEWTQRHLETILRRDPSVLCELIAQNVAVKAQVVQADEREESRKGMRAQLNLGHTYGHAIECIPSLAPPNENAPLQHGEAVALGLVAATHCAAAAGICPGDLPAKIESCLVRCGLPVRIARLPDNGFIIARMMHDKKVASGQLRVVLPTRLGEARLFGDVPHRAIEAGLDAIRS